MLGNFFAFDQGFEPGWEPYERLAVRRVFIRKRFRSPDMERIDLQVPGHADLRSHDEEPVRHEVLSGSQRAFHFVEYVINVFPSGAFLQSEFLSHGFRQLLFANHVIRLMNKHG